MTPARIGIDASALVIARKNGYENYVTRLLMAMASLEDAVFDGLDLRLYVYAGNRFADAGLLDTYLPQLRRFACRVHRPRRGFGLCLPALAALDRLDWLHLPVNLWSRRFPCRVLTTVHDLCSRRWLSEGGADLPEIRAMERMTTDQVQRSDGFIAVSESTRRDMLDRLKVPGQRVYVVPHGSDGAFADSGDSVRAVRAHYRLPPYILSVNALQGNKNYGRLVRAFARLAEAGRSQHILVIVGRDGWGGAAVRAEIEAAGLGERVRLLGFVPQAHLAGLYAGADLVVNASLCEGFGIPVIEALEAGAVVAAARATSFPEVGGAAVALFDPYDEIEMARVIHRSLTDVAYRAALRVAARERLMELTWERAARGTLAVYRSLVESDGGLAT